MHDIINEQPLTADNATGNDLESLIKDVGLEEGDKTKGVASDELLWDTTAQNDVTTDDASGQGLK